MNPVLEGKALYTRRQFFGRSVLGVGTAALASLLNKDVFAAAVGPAAGRRGVPGPPELPHFAPKAKRVIYLFQNGAPFARGSLRLQAAAAGVAREADSG